MKHTRLLVAASLGMLAACSGLNEAVQDGELVDQVIFEVPVLRSLGEDGATRASLTQDEDDAIHFAWEATDTVGIYPDRAEELAERSVAYADENVTGMTEAVVAVLCDTATYVTGLALGFLLILIFLTAIANVGNLSFRLPNLELLDEIGGATLGFVKGLIYCILLSWLLSFFGLIIGKDTLIQTTLARFFLSFRFLTGGLL